MVITENVEHGKTRLNPSTHHDLHENFPSPLQLALVKKVAWALICGVDVEVLCPVFGRSTSGMANLRPSRYCTPNSHQPLPSRQMGRNAGSCSSTSAIGSQVRHPDLRGKGRCESNVAASRNSYYIVIMK